MAVSAAFLAAFEAHRAGRIAEAERGYRAVLATEPQNADAWHLLGLVAQHYGDLKKAATLVEKALTLAGQNGDFLANLGVIYEAQGRSADAVRVLDQAIRLLPAAFNARFARANALKSLERYDEALAGYQDALKLQSDNASIYNNIGTVFQKLERLEEAADAFSRAISLQPAHSSAHYNLGLVLKDLGRAAEAAESFRRAMTAAPGLIDAQIQLAAVLQDKAMLEQVVARARLEATTIPDEVNADKLAMALNELAQLHKRQGRLDVAAELFDSVVTRRPHNLLFRSNLGNALNELNRAEEAVPHLREAARLAPKLPENHYNLGNAFKSLGEADEAIACYRHALLLRPSFTKARINLGGVLTATGRYEEASVHYDESLQQDQASAELWDGRGALMLALNRPDDAIQSFRHALALNPELAEAHRNVGLAHLMKGQFSEGWHEYEWRWRCAPGSDEGVRFPWPAWQGQGDAGGIVVWGEQGIGDRVLYAGMIPDLQAQGHRVVMESDPRLHALFARSFPGATMVAPENPPAPATTEGMRWKSALASLGQYLRPDAAHFPQRAAYLKADTGRSAAFKAYLDQQGRGPIVGIAWGSYGAKIGHHKSLDLKAWGDILRTPNVRFVDLQYGDTAQERAEASAALGVSIIHVPDLDLREDIDGAAALTAVCDLVISVSNTAVHLAAGLGVPTWVMVPRAAGNLWYWMWDTDRTPWYPSVRIFRQSRAGYWGDVLNDVKGRLDEYLAASA